MAQLWRLMATAGRLEAYWFGAEAALKSEAQNRGRERAMTRSRVWFVFQTRTGRLELVAIVGLLPAGQWRVIDSRQISLTNRKQMEKVADRHRTWLGASRNRHLFWSAVVVVVCFDRDEHHKRASSLPAGSPQVRHTIGQVPELALSLLFCPSRRKLVVVAVASM